MSTQAFLEIVNALPNLDKKKKEILPFLWGFKEYFETKIACLTDEKVMVNSLNSLISIKYILSDFVYLLFKNLNDKIIQKSLRIYLKSVSEDKIAVSNLCEHLLYWKSKNFTKTGSDNEKFSLDFLILKQLDTCFEDMNLDKSILQQLS